MKKVVIATARRQLHRLVRSFCSTFWPCTIKEGNNGVNRPNGYATIPVAVILIVYAATGVLDGVAGSIKHGPILRGAKVLAHLGSLSDENVNLIPEIAGGSLGILELRSPLRHKAEESNAPLIALSRLGEPMSNGHTSYAPAKERGYECCGAILVWHFLLAMLGGFCGYMVVVWWHGRPNETKMSCRERRRAWQQIDGLNLWEAG